MNLSIYSFSLVPGSSYLTPEISIYTLPAGIVTGISGLDTQTMLVSRFQLYWPIGLVCKQLLTKEAFPAGSTVTTAAVVWNAPKAISFTPNTQNCYCLLSTNCFLWRTRQVKISILLQRYQALVSPSSKVNSVFPYISSTCSWSSLISFLHHQSHWNPEG